jgi:stearoyl-CoA desaturase (Delta-9 desaturase)
MTKHYNLKTMDMVNTIFLTLTPVVAIAATWIWLATEGFDVRQLIMAIFFFILTGLSITAGYHRLYSHRAYDAHPIIRFLFLCFGAAAFQNSILKWGSDHRLHHTKVDSNEDPYNINEGFFYAHIGWIFLKENGEIKERFAKDLYADKMVVWQHKYYIAIAVFFGIILPTLVGGLFFGSYLGGFALGAMAKVVFIHHMTFFINSLCHYVGSTPYTDTNTAKDSWLMAFFTFGEGYHNFHHYFQTDYRNGVRWFQFDPTKWSIKLMSYLGLASKLKKTSDAKILNARLQMKLRELKARHLSQDKMHELELLKEKIMQALEKFEEMKEQFKQGRKNLSELKMVDLQMKMTAAKEEFQQNLKIWKDQLQNFNQQFA